METNEIAFDYQRIPAHKPLFTTMEAMPLQPLIIKNGMNSLLRCIKFFFTDFKNEIVINSSAMYFIS